MTLKIHFTSTVRSAVEVELTRHFAMSSANGPAAANLDVPTRTRKNRATTERFTRCTPIPRVFAALTLAAEHSFWVFRYQLDFDHERGEKQTLYLNPSRGWQRVSIETLANVLTLLECIEVGGVDVLFHDIVERQSVRLQCLLQVLVGGVHRRWHLTLADGARDVEPITGSNSLAITDFCLYRLGPVKARRLWP